MKHRLATAQCVFVRVLFAEIAKHNIGSLERGQELRGTRLSRQQTQLRPGSLQRLGNMAADKSRRACDKSLHEVLSVECSAA